MKNKKTPKLCLVSSSGGHWEQLQKLKVLVDKYDGFLVTEIVIYSKNLERAYYYVMKNFEFRQ